MKVLFYLLIAVLISACGSIAKKPYVLESSKAYSDFSMAKIIFVFPYYNTIVFSGPMSVSTQSQPLPNQLSVNGTEEALKHFSASVNNGILTIRSSEPVNVKINLPSTVQKIYTRHHANIHLTGTFVLSRIEASGDSLLHLYWIDSHHLHVIAKNNAKLFLAGVVTTLDLFAGGDAEVDAKYLRVENAYVKTQNDADVELTVKHSLGSLSSDRSTIYYYRDSDLHSSYLNHSGSSLRMVGIPSHH